MAPAARQSLLWSACIAAGYAGAMLAAEVAISNADQAASGLWGEPFWLRLATAVAAAFCLWPFLQRLAARPGFLESYGRYLTPTLLALSAAAMLGALLGSETPAWLHLIAPLVGARAP